MALLPLQWPDSAAKYFAATDAVSSVGAQTFALGCVAPSDLPLPYFQALCATVSLLVLLLFWASFWIVCTAVRRAWMPNTQRIDLKSRLRMSLIVVLFLVHISLVRSAASLLACTTVAESRRLVADLDVECGAPNHVAWAAGMGAPLLLVVLSAPLATGAFLRRLSNAGKLDAKRETMGKRGISPTPTLTTAHPRDAS